MAELRWLRSLSRYKWPILQNTRRTCRTLNSFMYFISNIMFIFRVLLFSSFAIQDMFVIKYKRNNNNHIILDPFWEKWFECLFCRACMLWIYANEMSYRPIKQTTIYLWSSIEHLTSIGCGKWPILFSLLINHFFFIEFNCFSSLSLVFTDNSVFNFCSWTEFTALDYVKINCW